MSRNAAQVSISYGHLAERLGLSPDCRIVGVIPANEADLLHGTVRLLVEGEYLTQTPEGVAPPKVEFADIQPPTTALREHD